MNKIPDKLQSVVCASNQIKNLSKAVEELVYNSLDAEATSIAVRINIQENTIQVIDNGCGVYHKDFYSIGQKYMTSKFVDLATLKSLPSKYGFRGLSLANIVNVSKTVKVISRHEKSGVTWMKLFEHGIEKQIKICNPSPSKGTTIEVSGFLYNQNAWFKSKDYLCEMQNVKKFLELLSLVQSNISLSLRDDFKNEIIFTMHKNRDTYQTLWTLYNIRKEDLQELQVEKNDYKVTAFLGKSDKDTGRHYIFLNGKYLDISSRLHKLVNNNFGKYFSVRGIKKPKSKTYIKDEENCLNQKIPFYFIFIKCPYIDYNLSSLPKQLDVEFNDWNHVTKLLDKLIKFFKGDINLKIANKVEKNKVVYKGDSDTREQVKKIMEKILGSSNSKKSKIINMHNGIKGKQIKRKVKKMSEKENNSERNDKIGKKYQNTHNQRKNTRDNGICDRSVVKSDTNLNTKVFNQEAANDRVKKQNTNNYSRPKSYKSCSSSHVNKSFNVKFRKVSNNKQIQSDSKRLRKAKSCNEINKPKKSRINKIIQKFERPTDSVKTRMKALDQKIECKLNQLRKRKCEVVVTEKVRYSNITKDNVNVSIRKQVDEIVIHNYMPRQPKYIETGDFLCNSMKNKAFHSNYDLLQTILKTQDDINVNGQVLDVPHKSVTVTNPGRPYTTDFKVRKTLDVRDEKHSSEALATFQSHYYYTNDNNSVEYNSNDANHYKNQETININDVRDKKPKTFITNQSRDNFMIPSTSRSKLIFKKKHNRAGYPHQFKSSLKRLFRQSSKIFEMKNQIMGHTSASSYAIEFTQSNNFKESEDKEARLSPFPSKTQMSIEEKRSQSVNYSVNYNNFCSINTKTYILPKTISNGYTKGDWDLYETYTIEHPKANVFESEALYEDRSICDENSQNNRNYIFISKSQENDQSEGIMDPINVCETILDGKESFNGEFEFSFSAVPNDLSADLISHCGNQGKINKSLHNNNKQTYIHAQSNDVNEEVIPKQGLKMSYQELSRQFILTNNKNIETNVDNVKQDLRKSNPILTSKLQNLQQRVKEDIEDDNRKNLDTNLFNFNIKNRPSFMPKGMSQIFGNCHTKNTCEYNLSADYYEDVMYSKFFDNVTNNAEIFEPKILEANERSTKALDKVNNKLHRNNSSLKFDGQSLRSAKVLGQVDEKFIAAVMKEGYNREVDLNFLVLFDQHAVHERIRLEHNLAEYFYENQWKPVTIDKISLWMSNDDILYLHNYKDKFVQLGLQWTVLNKNEVSVAAIPEAILGKNIRQVDKVIMAVKKLISEEINIIKMQGGCVSLYPKSIMDLVFSEACRYAIMFGDKLSKNECEELLRKLSKCKTPFQCAHGRPVMAVIMDVNINAVDYKVNINKIKEWKRINLR